MKHILMNRYLSLNQGHSYLMFPSQLEKVFKAVSLIQWDLPRTFPTLAFFHDGGAMHTGLERVLLCYALYRPNIGYVQVLRTTTFGTILDEHICR